MTDQNFQPQADPQVQAGAQQPAQQYQQPAQQQYQQPTQQYQQPTQQPMQQQPYQQPAQQQYQQPYQQPADYQYAGSPYGNLAQQYQAAAVQIEDKSSLYIGLSIAELVLCGILGIIPLILSIQYRTACQSGNAGQAAAKRKSARTALIVILIVGIVIFIGAFMVGFMGAVSSR